MSNQLKRISLYIVSSGILWVFHNSNALATSINARSNAVVSNPKTFSYSNPFLGSGQILVSPKSPAIVESSVGLNWLNSNWLNLNGNSANWQLIDGKSLSGGYQYSRYSVCLQQPNGCGGTDEMNQNILRYTSPPSNFKATVGLEFLLTYEKSPNSSDPIVGDTIIDRAQNNGVGITDTGLTWIQIVNADKLTPSGYVTGQKSTFLDVGTRSDGTPYYLPGAGIIKGATADTSTLLFDDAPQIGNNLNSLYDWNGQLFLAKVTNPTVAGQKKSITIYDGVAWGWQSSFTPEKNSNKQSRVASLSRPSLPGLLTPVGFCPSDASFYHSCSTVASLENSEGELIQDNLYFVTDPTEQIAYVSTQGAEPVPTPALLPSMIATGVYHGRKWRKRKQRGKDDDYDRTDV